LKDKKSLTPLKDKKSLTPLKDKKSLTPLKDKKSLNSFPPPFPAIPSLVPKEKSKKIKIFDYGIRIRTIEFS